jgi:hypothetical protein
MKNIKYMPGTDSGKGVWFDNFNIKLPLYATVLGVTNTELQSVQDDNNMYQYIIRTAEAHKQTLSNLLSYKNMLKGASGSQHIGAVPSLPVLPAPPTLVPEGIFDRVSQLVARIKKSFAYSDNIGADLGVLVSATVTIDVDAMQPDITVRLDVGRPRIKWVKGYSDAIDLYADRNDGNGFVFLGRSLKSEYIDMTVLAATKVFDEWKYKAIYVIGDSQVGLYSNVVSIDVKKI